MLPEHPDTVRLLIQTLQELEQFGYSFQLENDVWVGRGNYRNIEIVVRSAPAVNISARTVPHTHHASWRTIVNRAAAATAATNCEIWAIEWDPAVFVGAIDTSIRDRLWMSWPKVY